MVIGGPEGSCGLISMDGTTVIVFNHRSEDVDSVVEAGGKGGRPASVGTVRVRVEAGVEVERVGGGKVDGGLGDVP